MPDIFDSGEHKRRQSEAEESLPELVQDVEERSTQDVQSEPEDHPDSERNERVHKPKHHKRSVDDYSEVMRRERPTQNSIGAYAPKPLDVAFSTQNPDEDIILLLRQHPITQLKWVLIALVLAAMPILFTSIGMFSFLPDSFYAAGLVGWYLLVLGFIIESFLRWFYNVYIITDERIVDVDFDSLLHRNISSAKIDNIEDVTATAAGFAATLFDYGTVVIQTAAEKREFEFPGVPHPSRVTSLINEMVIEEEREKLEGRVS
jgi:hypothetical protein